MANVTVKLFGVFRSDTHMAKETLTAASVADIFPVLNKKVDEVYAANKAADPTLEKPDEIRFKDALIYINGEKTSKKSAKLKDGDEVWVMSPASGG